MKKHNIMMLAMPVLGVALWLPMTELARAQTTASRPANTILLPDHSVRASKLIGATVYNNQQEAIGTVVDLIVARGAAEPTAILSVGDYLGTGRKLVAVPLSRVKLDSPKPMMPLANKERLARMPIVLFPLSDSGSG
jgi:sporulation protein YlmC with PRC-barrel domain